MGCFVTCRSPNYTILPPLVAKLHTILADFGLYNLILKAFSVIFFKSPANLAYFGAPRRPARPAKSRQNDHIPVPNGGGSLAYTMWYIKGFNLKSFPVSSLLNCRMLPWISLDGHWMQITMDWEIWNKIF